MDAYCERTASGLLNEPLNALTNATFLVAAWAAWLLAKRAGRADILLGWRFSAVLAHAPGPPKPADNRRAS